MSGCAVAILTDDRTMPMLLSRTLSGIATEIRQFASDSPTLVEDLTGFQPRLIFMRGTLVRCDAVEMLDFLATLPQLERAQRIVLSNGGAHADVFMEHGAAACVPIPFTPLAIRSVVEMALRRTRKVLYVEDSKIVSSIVVKGLKEQSYRVVPAFDGEEALALLQAHRDVDLVLTDADMPKLDGFSLCRAVKRDPQLCHLPVALLTGRDDEASIATGFDAGADDYITKPVVVPEVVARVDRLLRGVVDPRNERVLLLEKDPVLGAVIQRALGIHGLRCTRCTDPAAARALLLAEPCDLAIIDAALDSVDGPTYVVQLRREPSLCDLQIMLLSGQENLQAQLRMRAARVQSFLVKPFVPDRLLSEVERVLTEGRYQRHIGELRSYLPREALTAIEKRVGQGVPTPVRAVSVLKTVFFLDIVGFTTLCENMPPHAVVRFLNDVFDEIVPRLIGHGASIDKFVGDCVMALFPADLRSREAAVRASLDILALLPTLRQSTGVDLHVRIGMNAGPVVLGDIGSSHHRRDFTVIGDQVNVASRLQSAAGVDELFVSSSVLQGLPAWVTADSQGQLRVKGRREPIDAYRIPTALVPPDAAGFPYEELALG